MPGIVAHRGGAGLRPENTLAAIGHALESGADGIEIDVRLSRDSEVVVFHDAILETTHVRGASGERLSGEPIAVRELSFRDLRNFDVGYPRLRDDVRSVVPVPGERIPALGEVLDHLRDRERKSLLLIELKTDFHTAIPLDPHELTEAVLTVLEQRPGKTSFRLMSFDWRCLTHAMTVVGPDRCVFLTAPQTGTGAHAPVDAPWFAGHPPARYGGSAAQAIQALGGRHWGAHHIGLDGDTVAKAHQAGMAVTAWTVNEPRHLMRMQAFGVDCLITDYPDRAVTAREMAHGEARGS